MNWKLLKNKDFFNVGFIDMTPEEFVQSRRLPKVEWMKHPYRDRFIADPFILKVDEVEIVVLAEDCPFSNYHGGRIVELHVDRKTKKLLKRYELLSLDTHLSYPAIIRRDGKIYVYPENGQSGKLYMYEYDEDNHQLVNPKLILDEAVADATIIERPDGWYLTATSSESTRKNVYLYKADTFDGRYVKVSSMPFNSDVRQSRPAGDFFQANGELYRPSQDCEERYGAALSIMKVDDFCNTVKEHLFTHIGPVNFRYNLGIHTINFYDGMCVIDGYGYLHPFVARCYYWPKQALKSLLKFSHLKK